MMSSSFAQNPNNTPSPFFLCLALFPLFLYNQTENLLNCEQYNSLPLLKQIFHHLIKTKQAFQKKKNPEYLSFCSTFPKQLPQNPQATFKKIKIIIYSATKQSITQKINWPRELGCTACELGGRAQCAGAQGSWLCCLLAPTDQELELHWRKGPP